MPKEYASADGGRECPCRRFLVPAGRCEPTTVKPNILTGFEIEDADGVADVLGRDPMSLRKPSDANGPARGVLHRYVDGPVGEPHLGQRAPGIER